MGILLFRILSGFFPFFGVQERETEIESESEIGEGRRGGEERTALVRTTSEWGGRGGEGEGKGMRWGEIGVRVGWNGEGGEKGERGYLVLIL